MKKWVWIFGAVIFIFLILPLIIKGAEEPLKYFKGTSLDSLTFSEVQFRNYESDLSLGGMLFEADNGFENGPLVIMVHGSGSSHRDNSWYLSLVQLLQSSGISVLLPDKRGSERSEGRWQGSSIEELAGDTTAAYDFIMKNYKDQFNCVGFMGVSQGGWVAPVAALQRPGVDFVIDLSGTLSTAKYQLHFEEVHNIGQYTWEFVAEALAPLTVEKLKNREDISVLIDFDPLPYWKEVPSPVFIAYGGGDTNCPVERSLERIREEGLQDLQVHVYPEAGHALLNPEGTGLNQSFKEDLKGFISKQCNKKL
ncbi:alpha/beta hydrolase family protein [Robertkochia aurantiaca]|uniref:alpha/beta hydrolase family protein n=1 Tax=Robertkochia aurantiaca TaxID=2873700 RepID=UPI001CCA1635|nr:alpha/beta fold hydrolase [Robertkochia sp. 3YJGBD-33]